MLTQRQSNEVVVDVADLAPSNKKRIIRVLHVDDDPSIREISKQILMDMGSFDIDSACCVGEAFKKLSTEQYDVVISDYEMPQKDGLQFLKELREQNNDIPFILFTGKGREEVAIKALNLGADAYHNKLGSPETVYGEITHSIKLIVEHNKTKEALREQDIRFTKLAAQTPGMLFQFLRRPDGTFCVPFTSDGIYDIFGCSPQDVQKDFSPIVQAIVPEDTERVIRSIEHSAAHLSLWQCEYRVQLSGQKIRWLWGQSAPERLEDGSILWSGYNTDITERKNAEEKLRGIFEVLERVSEGVDAGLAVIGKDYGVVWANKHLMDLGVAPNKKCYQIFNRSETICPDCGVKKIFEQNVTLDVHEFKTVNSKGETIWIELRVTPLKDKDGNLTAALELAVPITERKNSEKQIESLARFPFENPNVVIRLDSNGKILYSNPASQQLANFIETEAGKSSSKSWKSRVKEALSTSKQFEFEESYENRTFSFKFFPIVSEGYVNVYGIEITERKKAKLTLVESEEKFRTITSSVKDSIILIDDEAKVVYWNPAAEKTFGYSSVEAIGKDLHELVVPKTMCSQGRECIKTGIQQFTHTGSGAVTNGNFELLGQRKDGTEFPAKLSVTPIKMRGKWSAVGVVKDITERKQAEQTLRDTEKRYRTLFNQAPSGVLIIDPQTEKAVEFNDVAHIQLGYSREEFSKLRISDFEAKKTGAEINVQTTKILMNGEDEFETKHRTKNGEIRDVIVTARTIELAGKSFLDCVFHDITEIRRIQNALMESETKYRQLVNSAQEGIWALDSNYLTVFVNSKIAQMLGYSESEMVGKNIFELLNKKCVEQAKQLFSQVKQGARDHFDCEIGGKNNSNVYVGITASVINDDEGKPSGILLMVSDITDRKVLERKVDNYSKHLKCMVDLRTAQLKDANERLVKSERLAAIGELAGMVGHDLRNPLAGIKNAAYFLKKKGTAISEAQAKEMLETIDKALEHSDKIINDLLDYAREMHLELTKHAAHTLVDEALRMIQVPNRIQIINHVQEDTLIWVNADKMMRVFINLIKNAIDAIPEKGTLKISSCQTKDCVEIFFADTGTGIPEETLKKLFTPLFTTKAQGMGFGLAICKRIIEAHGGTITVKTELNKGTTFIVTLPLKPKVDDEGKKHA